MANTTRIYSDIDMSFALNPVTGDIYKKVDVNAVKQSMKNLLLTTYYSKPFTPNYGSPLADLLFEPMDVGTAGSISILVEEALSNFEPRVRVDQVSVYPNYNEDEYKIQIDFYVRGVRQPQVFNTSLRRLR